MSVFTIVLTMSFGDKPLVVGTRLIQRRNTMRATLNCSLGGCVMLKDKTVRQNGGP